MGFTVLVLCRAPFYICLDKVRIYFLVCLMELYCVFTIAVGTAGNGGFPAGAPFLGKKWGKEPQREEVLPSGLPSLVGWCGGGCTSFLVPGLRPSPCHAGNGPPTGWAGWGRGKVPFEKRRRKKRQDPSLSEQK